MKNRLHDKKAGIFILVALILISLAELIFRAVVIGEKVYTTPNVGEQLVVIALALTILILTAMKKDRVCYILYGVWIGYFVLDQLFELPSAIITGITIKSQYGWIFNIGDVASICIVIGMAGVIALGALLLEYMNDGSIYNRAFNIICVVDILLFLVGIIIPFHGVFIVDGHPAILLTAFTNLYRIGMIFLFAFFAYDSAKKQLSKVNFDK